MSLLTPEDIDEFALPTASFRLTRSLIDCLLFLCQELIAYCYNAIHLAFVVVGSTFTKNLIRVRRFKSERNEIWQNSSSSKYASIDRLTESDV